MDALTDNPTRSGEPVLRRSFTLSAFPGEESSGLLTIHGALRRNAAGLAVTFVLEGALDTVVIPEGANQPERRDNLWQATCLEVFIGEYGQTGYLECNLSPAGHWNLYAFTGYREGMQQEETVQNLTVHTTRATDRLTVSTVLPLDGLAVPGQLCLGVSAVLLHRDGVRSHWALTHPGPVPDFHNPEGFLLRL